MRCAPMSWKRRGHSVVPRVRSVLIHHRFVGFVLRTTTALAMADEGLKTLAATNAMLVEKLIDHEKLVREHDELSRRFYHVEQEARDAKADKVGLEQEMRLASAQKAARRASTLTVAVPLTIGMVFNVSSFIFMILWFARLSPGYGWLSFPASCIGGILIFLGIRPTNTISVRTVAVGMIPADFLPAFLGMIALATTPCWYAPWRPMAWPVCYTFAITMTSMIPAMPIIIYIMHGTAGSAAKLWGPAIRHHLALHAEKVWEDAGRGHAHRLVWDLLRGLCGRCMCKGMPLPGGAAHNRPKISAIHAHNVHFLLRRNDSFLLLLPVHRE